MNKKIMVVAVLGLFGVISIHQVAVAQNNSQSIEEQRSKCKARCSHEFRQESSDDLVDCQKFCDDMFRYEKCIKKNNLENCASNFEDCAQQCRDKECVNACAQKAKACEMPCKSVFPKEPPQLPGAGKAARESYQ